MESRTSLSFESGSAINLARLVVSDSDNVLGTHFQHITPARLADYI